MSDAFFRDLGMREPNANLEVSSGSHAQQAVRVMAGMDSYLAAHPADLVVVIGDVNSTVAAALTAAKLGVPVAHLEAGLRSGDRRMPEEINRIVTDQLSDLCLTPSRDVDANLAREGIGPDRVHFVGNVMIDSLLWHLPAARALAVADGLGLDEGRYVMVTLHRPSNVDEPGTFREIASALEEIAARVPVVFPVHPRTAGRAADFSIAFRGARIIEPLGYLAMLSMLSGAGAVLTDSEGIQEESTVLGVPCLTLRDSTERPVTITHGTNRLVPDRTREAIVGAFTEAWGTRSDGLSLEFWDGAAAERVADVLSAWRGGRPSP